MSNLTTQTPVQIDTKLAELYGAIQRGQNQYHRIARALREGRFTTYTENDALKAERALIKLYAEAEPLEVEYERRPWNRYWHVTNANGHIHTDMYCSSCFPDTQYNWRTDLSGLTEQEVVDREAYNACSVCMPIAPAEQKAARERYTREQREARKAEKDQKKADKAKKALDRARKHAVKVEKALLEMTGEANSPEAMIVFRRDFSLHGHDGRKSVYEATMDMPQMVHDTLYTMKMQQEDPRAYRDLSDAVKTALTERGLI
jgi:hypothetical protein